VEARSTVDEWNSARTAAGRSPSGQTTALLSTACQSIDHGCQWLGNYGCGPWLWNKSLLIYLRECF